MRGTLISVLLIMPLMPAAANAQGTPTSQLYVLARDVRQKDLHFYNVVSAACGDAWQRFKAEPPADPKERLATQLQFDQMHQQLRLWGQDIQRRRDLESARDRAQCKAERGLALIASALPLWP
jgi:hypothetical protein